MIENSFAASATVFHSTASLPYILDNYNRARFFHGTNFVEKDPPYYCASLLNETNVATLAEMGFNTIRLGFLWNGAQPKEGADGYDENYFHVTDEIVALLNKYEIYPFLDVHQDVLSTKFCLYDAFPPWAIDKMNEPKKAFPWPLKAGAHGFPCPIDRSWSRNYLADATGTAFQTLYTPDSVMQQAFWAFWQETAKHYKSQPILGYEIINEPWAGDIYSDPALLLPGHAGEHNLMPFYDTVSAKIREIDADHMIFYEPVTWGMIFNGNLTGSGFKHVPGGDEHKDKAVFSFHYYCWWYADASNDLTRETCDRLFGPKVFEQAVRDTKYIGGATMLTEWGQGCDYTHASPYDPESECNAIMSLAEKYHVSWTDWYFGEHLLPAFDLSDNAKRVFSRTFAKIVAGRPKQMHYDVTTREYHLSFSQVATEEEGSDVQITSAISEIYVPFASHYPDGIDVETSKNLEVVSIKPEKNQVLLRNREVPVSEGEGSDRDVEHKHARVTIKPKTVAKSV